MSFNRFAPAQKLIKPGSGKRNPFKRSGGAGSSSTSTTSSPNPIKHLTDSIVGLPSNESFGSRSSIGSTAEKEDKDSEKLPPKSPARKPFSEWFKERKAELVAEMPEGSNPVELTSFAMKKYKETTVNGMEASTSAKRKLEEKENEGSGIAKLAKFRVET